MRTKHPSVIHIRNKGDGGTIKHVKALQKNSYWPFQGDASFVDPF